MWSENFTTVHALKQTNGQGRFSRKWFSADGEDLTFSTLFIPPSSQKNYSAVTFYSGLAVFRSLRKHLDDKLKLKWPNDIYYNGKKICGVLSELMLTGNRKVIIIGIGINVNNTFFPGELNGRMTSMKKETGKSYNINLLLDDIVLEIEQLLKNYSLPVNETILTEWKDNSDSINKNIYYEYGGKKKEGVLKEICNDCSLLIYDNEFQKIIQYNGEIFFGNSSD